jgi:hypothetical protein
MSGQSKRQALEAAGIRKSTAEPEELGGRKLDQLSNSLKSKVPLTPPP